MLFKKNKRILLMGLLLVLWQSTLFSQVTKVEKKRASICSSSCFKDLLPKSGAAFGSMTDSSDVHYSGTMESILGSKAKLYNALKVVRMVEAEYTKGQFKFSIQIFEFSKKKSALRIWLKEKPQYGSKNFKGVQLSAYSNFKKKLLARFHGTLYFKVTTSDKLSKGTWKALNRLFIITSGKIFKMASAKSKWPYKKGTISKLDKVFDRLSKVKIKNHSTILVEKKEFPKILNFFPNSKGLSERTWLKKKNNKKVYTVMFIIGKKYFTTKAIPKTSSQKKVKDFLLKYTNRFRYYKNGNRYVIVGVYKNQVIGIYGNRYPKAMKKYLERFRLKYFFQNK